MWRSLKLRRFITYSTLCVSSGIIYIDLSSQTIQLEYQPNYFNKNIVENLSVIKKGFRQTIYLPSAFLQIVYAAKIEKYFKKQSVQFDRELIQMQDGGVVAIGYLIDNFYNKLLRLVGNSVILIVHGLTGGSDSIYIQQAAEFLADQGHVVVCFNQRGVAKSPLLNTRYHSHGDYSDLQSVINYLNEQFDYVYGVGISIGANLLIKYAGCEKDQCGLQGIVSISNPFNLQKCSDNILKWQNFLYDDNITKNFKNLLKQNYEVLKMNESVAQTIDRALVAKNTLEFDEYFTRRLINKKDVNELYNFISCENYVKHVQIPVLCIQSKNDPIVPYDIVPFQEIKQNENLIFLTTQKGGHVEWFTGLIPNRWVMNPTSQYLQILIKMNQDQKEGNY